MKRYLTIILIIVCANAIGQNDYLKIEKVSKGEDFSFPVIHADVELVQEKINILLQLSELDLIKGKEEKNIFEIVRSDDVSIHAGKVYMGFHILNNTRKNLAIKFVQGSCGMTCANWVCYYNFNPQNGDRYALQDFFTDSNFTAFKNYITPIRQQKIKKQIDELKKTEETGFEEIKYLEEYLYGYIEEDDLNDFYFTSDSLFFDNYNLLYKNDKYLYDFNHLTGIPIKDIQYLLNDFGKSALLTGENLKNFQSMAEPQLYEGTIGNKSEFYLLFRNEYENNFDGIYAYKKYGKAIDLEGKFKDSQYSFIEYNDNYEEIADITFEKDKTTLTGYWQNRKGNKLTFTAKRK